jgi:hypothetical protein
MQRGYGLSAGVGANIWQMSSGRFGSSTEAVIQAFQQVAGAAHAAGISMDEMASVQEDFLSAMGPSGVSGGVRAIAALTKTFGGGPQGAALAQTFRAPLLGAARGDVDAIQSLAMLGADPRLLFAENMDANAVIRSLDIGRLTGMGKTQRFAIAQATGIDVDALLALSRKGRITEADLTQALAPRGAAGATLSATEVASNFLAGKMDDLTKALGPVAINLGHLTDALMKAAWIFGSLGVLGGGLRMGASVFRGGGGGFAGAGAGAAATAAAARGGWLRSALIGRGAAGVAGSPVARAGGRALRAGGSAVRGISRGAARLGSRALRFIPGVGIVAGGVADIAANVSAPSGSSVAESALWGGGATAVGALLAGKGLAGAAAFGLPAAFMAGGLALAGGAYGQSRGVMGGVTSANEMNDAAYLRAVIGEEYGSEKGFMAGWNNLVTLGGHSDRQAIITRNTRYSLQNVLTEKLHARNLEKYVDDAQTARLTQQEVSAAMRAYDASISGGASRAQAAQDVLKSVQMESGAESPGNDLATTNKLLSRLIRVTERRDSDPDPLGV